MTSRDENAVLAPRITGRGLAVFLSVGFMLTACGGGAGGQEEGAPQDALPEELPDDAYLRIGDQQEQQQVLFEASGELDEFEFEYEFNNFVGGPAILEAFRGDALDVARVGDTPPIHALASGEDVRIILAFRTDPDVSRLATSPGTDISSIDDIEGARIAYAEGTAQASVVLRLLDRVGLTTDDVELVPLQLAEYSEALQAGEVDIAPLNGSRLARYLEEYEGDGAAYLPEEETSGLGSGLSFVYAPQEVLEDPSRAAALKDYVEHSIRVTHWRNENPDTWVQEYFVDNQGITEEEGWQFVEEDGPTVFPLLEDLIDEQQATIDLAWDAGELPVEIDANDMFDLRFDEVIEETVAELDEHHDREELDE